MFKHLYIASTHIYTQLHLQYFAWPTLVTLKHSPDRVFDTNQNDSGCTVLLL